MAPSVAWAPPGWGALWGPEMVELKGLCPAGVLGLEGGVPGDMDHTHEPGVHS